MMTREQIDAIERLYIERSDSLDASSYSIPELLAAARRALELEERMQNAIRFKFASGEHWSNDIEICRCEGNCLPKQPYMWAVRQGGNVLGKDGRWMYEPLPSSRDEEFYSMYRFDTYEDAEKAAMQCTPAGAINNARRGHGG